MADNRNNWLFSSYPSGNSECVGVVGHRATGAGGTFRSAVQKQLFRKGFATNTVVSLLELFFFLKEKKNYYKFLVLFLGFRRRKKYIKYCILKTLCEF